MPAGSSFNQSGAPSTRGSAGSTTLSHRSSHRFREMRPLSSMPVAVFSTQPEFGGNKVLTSKAAASPKEMKGMVFMLLSSLIVESPTITPEESWPAAWSY